MNELWLKIHVSLENASFLRRVVNPSAGYRPERQRRWGLPMGRKGRKGPQRRKGQGTYPAELSVLSLSSLRSFTSFWGADQYSLCG